MEITDGEQLAFFEAPPAPVPAFGEDPALDAVQTRPTKIALRMQGKAPGPLPKG